MIYWLLFFTILLLTLLQFGFFLSLKKKHSITKYLGLSLDSKIPYILFFISTLVFFIILFLQIKKLSTPIPNSSSEIVHRTGKLPPNIVQMDHNVYQDQERYYYLYTGSDKTEQFLSMLVQKIRAAVCTKPCTINLYDTTKAYALDHERLLTTSTQEMEHWNEENYVYVADHFLGYLPYIQYAPFSYYPYKDAYYDEHVSPK